MRVTEEVAQVEEGVQWYKRVHEGLREACKDQGGHVRLCTHSVSREGLGECAWMGKTYSSVTYPAGFPYDFLGYQQGRLYMAIT